MNRSRRGDMSLQKAGKSQILTNCKGPPAKKGNSRRKSRGAIDWKMFREKRKMGPPTAMCTYEENTKTTVQPSVGTKGVKTTAKTP